MSQCPRGRCDRQGTLSGRIIPLLVEDHGMVTSGGVGDNRCWSGSGLNLVPSFMVHHHQYFVYCADFSLKKEKKNEQRCNRVFFKLGLLT